MAVLSLPLTFTNSFWSQDYRRGLEVLFKKLEQGVAENAEIVAFIRNRAIAEGHLAMNLINPGLTGPAGTGFGADDGASLLMAFRGLQAESAAQGQAHKSIANELDTLVADPFEDWARGHAERIKQNKVTVVDNWLKSYEHAHGEVSKLKYQYLAKTRRADEAEDDAKFAPNTNGLTDKYTTSPRVRPIDGRTAPQRTASVSERISQRLKEIQKKSAGALSAALADDDPESGEKAALKVDKGKGRAVDVQEPSSPVIASPPAMSPLLPPRIELSSSPVPPMPPPPIVLAGLSLPLAAVSSLLTRAAAELPLRPVRFPLLGEYQDCFTGEEFASWLTENVEGFGGSLDRAEDAARELTEREGLLRRIGEFGNQFEHSDEAFYQFRPKAFDLEGKNAEHGITPSPSLKNLQPEKLIKRTGEFVHLVSKALNANSGEPAYIRARHEAEEADKAYRVAVRKLDRQRLGLEERLEETLKTLQRLETERLRAVKTALLQYQGTLANLPKSLEPSIERSGTLVASYQPESDLTALIERYRTGPFRPDAQVYESVSHDESDVVFGIDLRKWAEGGWHALTTGEEKKKELVPPVVTALLQGLTEAYGKLPDDAEKRKSWIYEVPLHAVHHLREAINAIPADQPIPIELITKYDAPVIASAVKLWMLELDPPLALYEGWDDLRRLYPTVGSSAVKGEEQSAEDHIQSLGAALQRLPRVHLYVLDAIVKHLKTLIDTTTVEEPNEVYATKLALSIGRAVVRPKTETELSIQDRHPTLLFLDLLNHYDAILPPTIARKKRESERKVPLRKRTAPIDMRLSRSRISVGADAQQLLAAQQVAQNPSLVKSIKSPELPPLPSVSESIRPPPPPPVVEPVPVAKPLTPPPPPPPAVAVPASPPAHVSPVTLPPPPPPPANFSPPRPAFKEPPPELDDLPPRPMFKEPPPELDDSPPTRPTFIDPPAEEPERFSPLTPEVPPPPPSPPITSVIPPTPKKRMSVSSGAPSPSPTKYNSRSPSPPEDQVLATGRTTLSRNSSVQSQGGVRGPRLARGPRTPGSGTVSSMVSNLNRQSPPAQASPISPRAVNRLSGAGSPVRRPSSVLGRSSAFSRRTMASDAEDDLVEKK
ncbi:Rho-GTPase-activating protein 8 [Hypsizygus marmoreus]|uniref:Rho-GTPase-activating protein 8 n=1 Tax=Hypsizygus marmoreus TaxID=39966 RepID=A0A369JN75_HYPMA|nr:Rho-GTPase-activating protein 8 [Hypsizygus marmoreus]